MFVSNCNSIIPLGRFSAQIGWFMGLLIPTTIRVLKDSNLFVLPLSSIRKFLPTFKTTKARKEQLMTPHFLHQ